MSAGAAAEMARQRHAAGDRVVLVSGHFDPLLAAHARSIAELAGKGRALMVSISDPPRPILDATARAELVAALKVIDHVFVGSPEGFPADEIHREEAADQRRTEEFIAHVQSRQGQ